MEILKLHEIGTNAKLTIPIENKEIASLIEEKGFKDGRVWTGKYLKKHLGPYSDVAEAIIENDCTYRAETF